MARLPDKYAISPVGNLRSGRPMATVDLGGEARGMQQAGAGLANLGNSITQIGAQRAREDRLVQGTEAETDLATARAAREEKYRNDTDYSTLSQRWGKDDGADIQRAALRIKDEKARQIFTLEAQKSGLAYNKRISNVVDAGIKDGRIASLETAWQKSHDLIANPATPDDVRTRTKTELDASITEGAKAGVFSEQYANDLRRKYVDGADYALAGSLVKTPDGNRAVLPPGGNTYQPPADAANLTMSMRNNNPGSIKYTSQTAFPGVVGPSKERDQGDPQIVFATAEDGIRATYQLALKKYQGGKRSANELIAGNMGWTPGNFTAASNIAKTAGLAPDQDLKLDTPEGATKFMRALFLQESGPKSAAYSDGMIMKAIGGDATGSVAPEADGPDTLPDDPSPTEAGPQAAADVAGHPAAPLVKYLARGKNAESVTKMQPALQQGLSAMFEAAPPEVKKYLSIFSGYRSEERQAQLWKAAVAKYGSETAARKWVAPPGRSQHNHGNAADLAYDGAGTTSKLTPAGKAAMEWAHANAAKFGLAFPLANEPWHVEAAGARGGGGQTAPPPPDNYGTAYANLRARFPNLSAEQIDNLATSAVTARNGFAVQDRAAAEQAVQDGPSALANTGRYDGPTLDRSKFQEVYGADGDRRFNAYDAAMKTAKTTFDMQTQSAAEIMAQVEAARVAVQQTTGEGADLADKRLNALQTAAAATIKARESDPAGYVQQAFPVVKQAWATYAGNPGDQQAYSNALTATAAAQEQLGIPVAKRTYLPDAVAKSVTETFKDATQPAPKRMEAVIRAVLTTKDPVQQRAVWQQLVKEGLPAASEGAVEAFAAGRPGDGSTLMNALLTDPAKLPKAAEATPAKIEAEIQTNYHDVLDAAYGLKLGRPENNDRAINGQDLMVKAAQVSIAAGDDIPTAVKKAVDNMYGKGYQILSRTDQGMSASVLVSAGQDPRAIGKQLDASLSEVVSNIEDTIKAHNEKQFAGKPGALAIAQADAANQARNVFAQGKWVNLNGGYAFVDPYTNGVVPGKDGKPFVVKFDPSAPVAAEAPKPTAEEATPQPAALAPAPATRWDGMPADTAPLAPQVAPISRPEDFAASEEAAKPRVGKDGRKWLANPKWKDEQGNIVPGESQWIETK